MPISSGEIECQTELNGKVESTIEIKGKVAEKGPRGYSAYEIAKQHGYEGTEEEWLLSLKGEDGEIGPEGPQGIQGEQGPEGPQGPKGEDGKDAVLPENIVIDENYVHTDNNYTNADKQKLAGLSNYDDSDLIRQINDVNALAEQNERDITNLDNKTTALEEELQEQESSINHLDDIKANKTEIPDVSQFIKKTVNDLTNYYLKTETYTQQEVNQLVGTIKSISMKIVPERPEIGETNIIYLVPSAKTTPENIYDEYVYIDGKWEIIGSTAIDLSDYYTKDEINTLLFDYITSNDLEEALENYALKSDVITKTSELENDSNFIDKDYVDGNIETLNNKINDIELFKFPNAIIHGEPTINNGQVSDFTRDNYLSLPAVFNLHDRGFEFNLAFRTNSDVTTAQNILGSRFCMALLIEGGKLKLRVSQNGSSWDLVDITGDIDLQPNTTYYTQIYFDKLTYKLRYSLDGIDYTDIASKVASVSPNPSQIYLGVGNNFFNPFKGIINLNKCNLKVNNSVVWQGMDDAGLATRLATDLENIDEAGIEAVKEIARQIITIEDGKLVIR